MPKKKEMIIIIGSPFPPSFYFSFEMKLSLIEGHLNPLDGCTDGTKIRGSYSDFGQNRKQAS